ncbi:Mitochondrial-processing peptidase subunit beta [Astathelohania contejeani]|uniref:Mitochondrial-processing peptidase subunit beta n=1 Tax=Astathelohania contejeani TaxID=164912 RepID=A0ABQ7I0F0_9MICR|nr:Mitochondrial-processing peptidase subunit beta [Thelohania contejeani]
MALPIKILDNGLRLSLQYCMPSNKQPSTEIGIFIKSGPVKETPTNNGVTHFIEHLIFRNNASPIIKNSIKNSEIKYKAYTAKEYSAYLFNIKPTITKNILHSILDLIFYPKLTETLIEKEKEIIKKEYENTMDNEVEGLLEKNHALLFGNTKLGLPILGTKVNIEKMNKRLIEEFHKKIFIPENMAIVVRNANKNTYEWICDYFKAKPGNSINIDNYKEMNKNSVESINTGRLISFKCEGMKNIFPYLNLKDVLTNINGKNMFKVFYHPYENVGVFSIYMPNKNSNIKRIYSNIEDDDIENDGVSLLFNNI